MKKKAKKMNGQHKMPGGMMMSDKEMEGMMNGKKAKKMKKGKKK